MTIEVTEFKPEYLINSVEKEVIILPLSADYELDGNKKMLFDKSDLKFVKTLRKNGIPSRLFESEISNIVYRDNRSIDWIGPTLYLGSQFFNDPEAAKLLMETISTFILEIFKAQNEDPQIKCQFAFEEQEKNSYKKIGYEGPVSGLNDVRKILETLKK